MSSDDDPQFDDKCKSVSGNELQYGKSFLPDIQNMIFSFLTDGEEAFALHESQLEQAIRLMDYINRNEPLILRVVLNPDLAAHLRTPQGNLCNLHSRQ